MKDDLAQSSGSLAQDAEVLKPCPFCGRATDIDIYPEDREGKYWVAVCPQCDAQKSGKSREDVITRWNKRATAPSKDLAGA